MGARKRLCRNTRGLVGETPSIQPRVLPHALKRQRNINKNSLPVSVVRRCCQKRTARCSTGWSTSSRPLLVCSCGFSPTGARASSRQRGTSSQMPSTRTVCGTGRAAEESDVFVIDPETGDCSCGHPFQMGLPCGHVLAALGKKRCREVFKKYYSGETLRSIYSRSVVVPSIKDLPHDKIVVQLKQRRGRPSGCPRREGPDEKIPPSKK